MSGFKYISVLLFFSLSSFYTSSQTVEKPILDFITVNQNNNLPVIHWNVSDPAQINGYAVKRFIRSYPTVPDNTWHTVKRIDNPNIFSFEDNSAGFGPAKPDLQSEIYEITAYKINGTDTVFSLPSDKHKTIHLQGDYNYCLNQISIKWNNYIGWGSDFQKYEIYCKKNNSVFIKIADKTYNDTVLIHENLNYNSDYTYFIKAIRNDGTESFSNLQTIESETVIFPAFLNINSAIVTNNNKFDISFTIDMNSDAEKYILYKSNFLNKDYKPVNEMIPSDDQLQFSDADFNSAEVSYYYIAASDYCGKTIFISDTISNIVLKSSALSGDNRINLLNWSDMYKTVEYQIYRSTNKNNYSFISGSTIHNYEDDIQNIYENQFLSETISGEFCYFVEIRKNNFINKSNVACAEQSETVFFPNAFNPKSSIEENRVFKPKAAFISNYKMTIYGAYGDVVFESNNPDKGWDGRLKNGKLAPVSTYLYFVSYKNSKGNIVKLKKYLSLVY